jgi:hypothetical protein
MLLVVQVVAAQVLFIILALGQMALQTQAAAEVAAVAVLVQVNLVETADLE